VSDAKTLETPEAMADRLWRVGKLHEPGDACVGIRADREAIAALCDEMAAEALREAERSQGFVTIAHATGARDAYRAIAAMLRGGGR
jgi:hypothetical protein